MTDAEWDQRVNLAACPTPCLVLRITSWDDLVDTHISARAARVRSHHF